MGKHSVLQELISTLINNYCYNIVNIATDINKQVCYLIGICMFFFLNGTLMNDLYVWLKVHVNLVQTRVHIEFMKY